MQVRIYKPAKSSMQSVNNKDTWLLEFVKAENSSFREELMGRTSSSDMMAEVKMKFPTCEDAVAFAKKHNYNYEVIMPQKTTIIKKSYASNFC
jgi:hypothetical protein